MCQTENSLGRGAGELSENFPIAENVAEIYYEMEFLCFQNYFMSLSTKFSTNTARNKNPAICNLTFHALVHGVTTVSSNRSN